MDIDTEDSGKEGFDGFRFARCGHGDTEGDATGGQVLGAMAIGEETVMPDPLEALGEWV